MRKWYLMFLGGLWATVEKVLALARSRGPPTPRPQWQGGPWLFPVGNLRNSHLEVIHHSPRLLGWFCPAVANSLTLLVDSFHSQPTVTQFRTTSRNLLPVTLYKFIKLSTYHWLLDFKKSLPRTVLVANTNIHLDIMKTESMPLW